MDIFDPDPAVMYPGSFVGYRFQVSGSASLDKGIERQHVILQQCGILTSVDSDKTVQPLFNLRNSK